MTNQNGFNKPQLTLGELITEIEKIQYQDLKVKFDFSNFHPTCINSWRGSYDELALNYTKNGEPMRGIEFLDMLKKTDGDCLEGWKGEGFLVCRNTPLWVDNKGECDGTFVVGIDSDNYSIYINTLRVC